MMNIDILCPGPSLRHYAGNDDHRIVIGVNRAVEFYLCDWWVFHDTPVFPLIVPMGLPKVLTSFAMHQNVGEPTAAMKQFEWTFVERLAVDIPHGLDWKMCSMSEAMALAYFLGATHVDLHGVDWSGTTEWDGTEDVRARHPERWNLERRIVGGLVHWLSGKGMTVRRVGYEHEPF